MISTGDKIANHAKSKIGKSYKWGAKGPDSFDCSGLAIWCHSQENITLSGNAATLSTKGTSVTDLKPGDLVFYDTNGSGNVSHVGIYIGSDNMVHAAGDKDGVKQTKITSQYWKSKYKGARRNWS